MHKTVTAFGGVTASFEVPYTHMPYDEGCLFYGLMNDLLTVANCLLRLVPQQEIVIDGADRRQQDLGAFVGDHLWQNPQLVDVFVRKNPFGASPEELDVVRPWRHAVRDLFVCLAADKDHLLCTNGRRAFAVGAMEKPASDFVHAVPSLMVLTLLPFKGGIVTDGKVLHLSDKPSPLGRELIAKDARHTLKMPVVSTAGELVAYSRAARGRTSITPSVQAQIDRELACLVLRALGPDHGHAAG